jgi:hypothetical protein
MSTTPSITHSTVTSIPCTTTCNSTITSPQTRKHPISPKANPS